MFYVIILLLSRTLLLCDHNEIKNTALVNLLYSLRDLRTWDLWIIKKKLFLNAKAVLSHWLILILSFCCRSEYYFRSQFTLFLISWRELDRFNPLLKSGQFFLRSPSMGNSWKWLLLLCDKWDCSITKMSIYQVGWL